MSHKESRETPYPPAFSHLESKVRQAQDQMDQLKKQIETMPKDQAGPGLGFNPPGFLRSRSFGSHDQRVSKLNEHIEKIRKDTYDQIQKETSQADPQTARVVREHALSALYPNPVKDMSVEEREALRQSPKDVEQSQEMMDAIASSYKQQKQVSPDKEHESVEETPSQKFMATFRFNKASITDKSPTKDADLDKDRD